MPFPFIKYFSQTHQKTRPGSQGRIFPDSLHPVVMPGRVIPCKHLNQEYQPYEPENNALEGLTCEDCGTDLMLPEPDWDAMGKEI
jgi:hypothetical protein